LNALENRFVSVILTSKTRGHRATNISTKKVERPSLEDFFKPWNEFLKPGEAGEE
jgi:hypothetical protein